MKHNHFAIFAAIVINQLLSLIWYADLLLPLPFVAAVVASVAFCYLLSWVFIVAVVDDWQRGLLLGLLFGVGMLAPTLAVHYVILGYDWSVILIDGAKEVIGAGIAGAIIATYRAENIKESIKGESAS